MRSIAILLLTCAAFGQAPPAPVDARPQFEVASIRPADPSVQRRGVSFSGTQFTANGVSARLLIEMAYEVQPYRLSDASGWIDSELYIVQATWSEANGGQFREMLQRLLEDRFQLVMGRESREQNFYALLARDAKRLQPTKTPGRPGTRARAEDRNVQTEFIATTMARFAEILSGQLNRMVVDETGLTGEYDFVLETEREVDEKTCSPRRWLKQWGRPDYGWSRVKDQSSSTQSAGSSTPPRIDAACSICLGGLGDLRFA